MTLTQLEYILAVHKFRHFGKAAKSCFVTQPTLSMQVQKLEDELGVILFDRSRSPVLATIEGERVIEQARVVMREQRRLLDLIEQSKQELSGDFRLAVIPTLSTYVLPLFLARFVAAHPRVNLIIQESKTEEILAMLGEDEIDAGLLATPLHDDSLVEKVLFYEPFYLFVAPDHPLARKRKVRERELQLSEIWLLDKGNCFRDQVLQICSEDGAAERAEGNIRFESGNLETLKAMALASSGYTVLPYLAVGQLSAQKRRLVREFHPPVPTREVSLVFRRSVLKQRVIEALVKSIVDALPKELKALDTRDADILAISPPRHREGGAAGAAEGRPGPRRD